MSEPKEWTIMFYFASDNDLSPVIVSQLKAIKDAGFQENIDVLVHFDPNECGVPTRIYDVNHEQKRLHGTRIGDGIDPFVRSLTEDDVTPDKIVARPGTPSNILRQALLKPDSINAEEELKAFLGFCRENHQAKRYILFLVGHGMVVGNDAFLPDNNPISAITLKKLGEILQDFTSDVQAEKGAFELLALHSCSLSAIEVAYELKGTANYMMASEGPAFVDGWPYRQLLKKIFDNLEKTKRRARRGAKGKDRGQGEAGKALSIDVAELVRKLYFLTLFNATDFLLAGYSHDLALCNLDPNFFEDITVAIQELVVQLRDGLRQSSDKNGTTATERGKRIKELVLLAHWEAQSYWDENYTDLFDFCRCLRKRCSPQDDLGKACLNVMDKLNTIVIHSENFGSKSQYSHGLSIYFPWSKPIEIVAKKIKKTKSNVGKKYEDEEKGILGRYNQYRFTEELGNNAWIKFLELYFDETQRQSRIEEDKEDGKAVELKSAAFAAARESFNPLAPLASLRTELKTSPRAGADCSCPLIKNYPQETKETAPKETQGKIIRNAQSFAITQGALKPFETVTE